MKESQKIAKLISIYEGIIHGQNNKIGLFDCYDTYYKGCWDDELKEVEKLKSEINN